LEENHPDFLPERERERLNIVPIKYSSGSYPELILSKT